MSRILSESEYAIEYAIVARYLTTMFLQSQTVTEL